MKRNLSKRVEKALLVRGIKYAQQRCGLKGNEFNMVASEIAKEYFRKFMALYRKESK